MLRFLRSTCMALLLSGSGFLAPSSFAQTAGIEPHAGAWKTWVIPSGKDFRAPPPPDASATASELEQLRDLVRKNDTQTYATIAFWDAGAPGYQWIELINKRVFAGQPLPPASHRIYTYMTMAMHDATIAAWESKYFYKRPRPSELDAGLAPVLPTPRSPSYPSEHAAAAGAAATVLAYFLPQEAGALQAKADEEAQSRVQAGVQFASDASAGLALGRQVAERVIEAAKADGSDAKWTGTIPTGPCHWTGSNPGNATLPGWKPILLTSPSEFRPPAPPDCRSDAVKAQTEAIRKFDRNFVSSSKAYYWQSPAGLMTGWYDYATKWLFEDKTDLNPPRAARAYALLAAVYYDAFIASNDGKFTYWYLRPHQLDPGIPLLFPVPNFPSYPSNHSVLSTARSEVLAYLFPSRAEFIRGLGKEAGDSRIWAGIHYEMDNKAGAELGKAVAGKFIAWARGDEPAN
jgi:membrane-associated phospholipid phosphatase